MHPALKRRVSCPGCAAVYQVDTARIPPRGGHLTCPACSRRWFVPPVPDLGPDGTQVLHRPDRSAPPTAVTSAPPAAQAPDEPAPRSIACPACGHRFAATAAGEDRKSVLVVDDQDFFRNFAVDLLADRYRTHVAKSTAEALRKVDEVQPDAIVLDLGLERGPDDGRTILEGLGGRIPVLVMTGRSDFDLYGAEWRELEALGARDLVVKSLALGDELATKVLRLIGA